MMRTIAQEWFEEGIKQGIEQGIEQGAIQATQENILALLEVRFGKISTKIAVALPRLKDLARLKDLFRQAMIVDSLEDFERSLVARR